MFLQNTFKNIMQTNISAENIQGYLTIEKTSHFYQTVEEGFATDIFIGKLMEQKSVCFDTETTDLNTHQAKLVGIAFSWEKGKGYYLPIPKEDDKAQHTVNLLRPFFEAEEIEKIGQNLKYDIKVMANYDIEVVHYEALFHQLIGHRNVSLLKSFLQPLSLKQNSPE